MRKSVLLKYVKMYATVLCHLIFVVCWQIHSARIEYWSLGAGNPKLWMYIDCWIEAIDITWCRNWYYLMSSSSYKLKPIVKGFWLICLSLNFLQYCCSCAKMRIQLFILLIAVGVLFTSSDAACLPDGGQCREKVRPQPQIFLKDQNLVQHILKTRWHTHLWGYVAPATHALRIS